MDDMMSEQTDERKIFPYKIFRIVPAERVVAYMNIGWDELHKIGTDSYMCKVMYTQMPASIDDCEFVKPYLVQRGKIERPLGKYVNAMLTDAVDMDYMGAAEFEFGALPKSLRRIEAQLPLYSVSMFDSICANIGDKSFKLRVFANFDTEEQKTQYESSLLLAFQGKTYLKEGLRIKRVGTALSLSGSTDFWWDIKNDVLFTFDKQFSGRIANHLQQSFAYMNKGLKHDQDKS